MMPCPFRTGCSCLVPRLVTLTGIRSPQLALVNLQEGRSSQMEPLAADHGMAAAAIGGERCVSLGIQ